jgi:hypothetical protein
MENGFDSACVLHGTVIRAAYRADDLCYTQNGVVKV